MDLKLVNASDMNCLEDYVFALITGIITLETIETYHGKAVALGLLKEDQECRANTIVWDIKRMIKLYKDQSVSVLELLPDDFDVSQCIASIAKKLEVKIPKKRKNKDVDKNGESL